MRKEVIQILHKMQKWRRGEGRVMPYTPKQFGIAIDMSLRVLRGISDEDFNKLVNEGNDIREVGQTLFEDFCREYKTSKDEG